MRSWASAIGGAALVVAGCATARTLAPARSATTTGVLKMEIAGKPASIKVSLTRADVDPGNDHIVKQLGMRGSLLLLTDSYASRAQSLSRCQAGHETWVRLIDTRRLAESWSKLAESCLHDVQPGDPIATWTGVGTTFTVNLLSEPSIRATVLSGGQVVMRH